jgi:hypothetical protein
MASAAAKKASLERNLGINQSDCGDVIQSIKVFHVNQYVNTINCSFLKIKTTLFGQFQQT